MVIERKDKSGLITQDSRAERTNPITFFDFPAEILRDPAISFDTADNVFVIEYGNKILYLQLDDSKNFIQALSGLRRLDVRPKKKRDTTYVYQKAFETMQKIASYRHKAVMYFLYTSNEGMINWALDLERGLGIFKWDSKVLLDSLYALKIIEPQK